VKDAEQSSKEINFTLINASQAQMNEASLSAAKKFKFCGTDGWQQGVTFDCTNKPFSSNSDETSNQVYRKGFVSTSKLKIEGSKLIDIDNKDEVFTKK
jgi:hypothetical protein